MSLLLLSLGLPRGVVPYTRSSQVHCPRREPLSPFLSLELRLTCYMLQAATNWLWNFLVESQLQVLPLGLPPGPAFKFGAFYPSLRS